ncbi:MAG: 4Fe-4S binding protein [Clostridia bacterium]|nr:4Fe-4S binding protein [Clostridia bacterium]
MRDNEGVYKIMNAIVYYSNTNQSKRIAGYFADKLDYALLDIFDMTEFEFDNLILVFPIYCQNLPDKIKKFLSQTQAPNLTLIATYGRMCHGNVLCEAQKKFGLNVIAAAYVPTKHSYLQEAEFEDFKELDCVVEKVLAPCPVAIPRSYKNVFSNFLKNQRSRIGVKIYKTPQCDGCNICSQICKNNAISHGVTNKDCIRCLKCINACPKNALKFKLRSPMRIYLKKKKQNKLEIYI